MLNKNFIEAVYERDIDLLLLEEFHTNPAFRVWFTEQLSGMGNRALEFLGAWHSFTERGLGESDLILLQQSSSGERFAILIENKIDAIPQPRQAARYLQRGRTGQDKGIWDTFMTCLVAPERYLANPAHTRGYDTNLSYEKIRDWFIETAANKSKAARLSYKARLVDEAIEQNRRGYQPVSHASVSRFWRLYWEFVQSDFPQLFMKRPGEKPAMADWPVFLNPEFGSKAKIVHKWRFGFVDLQFTGGAKQLVELRLANQAILPGDVTIVPASKSAAFRIEVPKIDRFKDFSDQLEKVRLGLEAADRLLDLFPKVQG